MKPSCAGLPQSPRFAILIAIRVVALLLLSTSLAQNAEAQRAETIQLGLRLGRDTLAPLGARKLSDPLVRDTTFSRASRTVRGALIGAGIGLGTGVIVAFLATQDEDITDHSMDGLAYLYFS